MKLFNFNNFIKFDVIDYFLYFSLILIWKSDKFTCSFERLLRGVSTLCGRKNMLFLKTFFWEVFLDKHWNFFSVVGTCLLYKYKKVKVKICKGGRGASSNGGAPDEFRLLADVLPLLEMTWNIKMKFFIVLYPFVYGWN